MVTLKQICNEVDYVITNKKNDRVLGNLVIEVIANQKQYSERVSDIAYEIHEEITYLTDSAEEAKKYNLRTFPDFVDFLQKIKKENSDIWVSES